MKKTFKKIAACLMATASLGTCLIGMSANASYPNSNSMILRNVSGAPGNITSGNLKIAYTSNGNYGTSYGFAANNSSAEVEVTCSNAKNTPSVTLNTRDSSASFNNIEVNSTVYASFDGVLSTPPSEWGTWEVYHA